MMDSGSIQQLFVAVMAKHLPPSASNLRLLDLDGRSGGMLAKSRADIQVTRLPAARLQAAPLGANCIDAIVAYDIAPTAALLQSALDILRPGGRFIALQPSGNVSEKHALALSACGFVRILVEPALDGIGVLLRGEKSHLTADVMARIQGVASADADALTLDGFRGRYIHLLVQRRPNKPAWALMPGETFRWRAAAVHRGEEWALLGFSSLPKAVAFLQPAVLAGAIHDINKVGKFSRATAGQWTWDLIINPTLDAIAGGQLAYLEIDPATAEAPDE